MSYQHRPLMTLGVIAAAVIPACRFVTALGALPAAAGDTLGVTRTPSLAIGDRLTVDVAGTAAIEAGAAIAAGAEVETDVNGKAITKAAGKARGKALEAAAGAGSVIEVLLYMA